MNHKYSTVLLLILFLWGASYIVFGDLTSEEIDYVCDQNYSILFKGNHSGEFKWGCANLLDIKELNITVNNITNLYNNYSLYSNNSDYLDGYDSSSFWRAEDTTEIGSYYTSGNLSLNGTFNFYEKSGVYPLFFVNPFSADGFRMEYWYDFENINDDWLVFRKTDGNDPTPDGGIAFMMTNASNYNKTILKLDGYGNANFSDYNLITSGNLSTDKIGLLNSSPTNAITYRGNVREVLMLLDVNQTSIGNAVAPICTASYISGTVPNNIVEVSNLDLDQGTYKDQTQAQVLNGIVFELNKKSIGQTQGSRQSFGLKLNENFFAAGQTHTGGSFVSKLIALTNAAGISVNAANDMNLTFIDITGTALQQVGTSEVNRYGIVMSGWDTGALEHEVYPIWVKSGVSRFLDGLFDGNVTVGKNLNVTENATFNGGRIEMGNATITWNETYFNFSFGGYVGCIGNNCTG